MTIITALGNEYVYKILKEKLEIIGKDIQYQEAVLDIIEDVDILILNSLLPGNFNIYEFINIIKYKNPNIEIIIILEKKNEKIEEFMVAKGINNIFYNNKITIIEIINKIEEIINKKNNIEKEIIYFKKNKKNIYSKIKNKIKNKINKKIKNNKINNKSKIITIIGQPQIRQNYFFYIFMFKYKK